jgi:hypothetical protein
MTISTFVFLFVILCLMSITHSELLLGFVGPIYPFFISLAVTIRLNTQLWLSTLPPEPQPRRPAAAWRGR